MTSNSERVGPFQMLLLALSVYVLVALIIETVFPIGQDTVDLLGYIDTGICAIFLLDFFWRFGRSKDKVAFMRWGWIDLLSSIPLVPSARIARVVRIVRVFRIIRAARATKTLLQHVLRNRIETAFSSAVSASILMVIFGSLAILQVERTSEANIRDAGDAVWWALSTVTTVGYGDRFPVTTEGRLIGVLLMIAGIGLFGTFTAMVAAWFVTGAQDTNEKRLAEISAMLTALVSENEKLNAELLKGRQVAAVDVATSGRG